MYSNLQENPNAENVGPTDGYASSGSESGGEENKNSGGGPVGLFCCFLVICCCCCAIPFSIMAVITSKGLTSCPVPSLANATEIPNFHSISTGPSQWSSFFFVESNVFNPSVSNNSRIGYWRTTKTWYLRDQWAYVQEGGTVPDVVAWTPFFAWQSTYNVKHCGSGAEYQVRRNRWGPWRYGAAIQQWQIYSGIQSIATATHVKEHTYWAWQIPNGWQTTVTSNQLGGAPLADMIQTYDSVWLANTLWYVRDYRPDVIGAWVISFMAVAEDQKVDRSNDNNYRRLRASSKDGESKELEGRGEEEQVV